MLMKILYFSLDYSPHDHRFLSALSDSRHEVYYARLQRGERQTEDRPLPGNIHQVRWAGGRAPFAWRDLPKLTFSLRKVLRQIQPDLVHAGPIQTCGLIATLTGFRPRLIMSWGFDLMQDCDRNAWWRWATRFVLRRAAYFTSDCQATRDRALAFGMDPARTVVFPWGVDLEHFRFQPRKRSRAGAFTLFCNRSWEPRYGVDLLAQAFVQVARDRQEVSLLLLGGGSQGSLIRQTLEGGGVIDRVTFAGQVSQTDLPRYYQIADLFISSSHVDGSSVSLMEALACGLPCLVSDIPANKEWVTDGFNGWLFPDGNADALAAKIRQAIADRQALSQVGREGRRTAEEKADWKKNFAKLLEAYQRTGESHA
jgi:glycosyltransferase involved in cell wall biosynthesis